jgi:SAM-dependent methyltransferase
MGATRLAAPGWNTTREQLDLESTAWAPDQESSYVRFTSVDTEGDPDLVVTYLDQIANAASGMKHYAMAAHALRRPEGPILDLGCGAGHDLVLLNSVGLRAIGVDPSSVLLEVASNRVDRELTSLARASGESLPFTSDSFSGCRIERVLMHVIDPAVVLAEAVRCLRVGSLITVYEPDWSEFRVRDDSGDQRTGWIAGSRHPGIGGQLWELLEEAGCEVLDRVEERSIWRSLTVLDAVIGLEVSIQRAIDLGRIGQQDAARWLEGQRAREAVGAFFAIAPKILVVAVRR